MRTMTANLREIMAVAAARAIVGCWRQYFTLDPVLYPIHGRLDPTARSPATG
jgi:hypothetical protein